MQHHVQAGRLDNLVKGILLGNVGHDDDGEVIRLVLVRVADLGRFVFGADGCDDVVALLEELFHDMGLRLKSVGFLKYENTSEWLSFTYRQ